MDLINQQELGTPGEAVRPDPDSTAGVHQRRRRVPGRGLWRWLLLGLVIIVGCPVALLSPWVRTELRDSFTRLPDNYTELYFASAPTVGHDGAGQTINAPVTLVRHGTAAGDYVLVATLTTTPPGPDRTLTRTITAQLDTPTTTMMSVPIAAAVQQATITVAIVGGTEDVHYRVPVAGAGQAP